ncbi:MAG: UDP-N-acetylmuramoyl-L-alanyl-D-glutamate--2,6-diaminopimelate ligase [Paludibacteraceae bacterium]|nr:UDP-N-acetylmuramoyl-L-alanyl-D-glutamate--2,6-diaminopimelate ligase [Paludibacteraceae bacterium]
MKTLKEILRTLDVLQCTGSMEVEVQGVRSDSRKVEKGDLFVATVGTKVDGHDFIPSVIDKGASVIVCEKLPENLNGAVVFVQVPDANEALGRLASAWYDYPSSHLRLVGVTGTNGKTTTATLLYQLFGRFGHRCGLLSTVCNYIAGEARPSTHTTPDPISLNALLADMVAAGCEYAFMEVSSHSIDQRRIAGLSFVGGVFSNITRDHLDYHKTFANYLAVKKRFFDELPSDAFALTNADDKNGLVMLQNTKASRHTYSTRSLANFKAKVLEDNFDGMLLEMNGREVVVPFIGRFNASNLLAVFGTAVLLGKPEEEVLVHLSALRSVSGRFEVVKSADGYRAIVDYAHTPDALMNVINTINEIRCGAGRLITVVGCGGDRDKGKRPMMAKEALAGSDQVILTSDNPRSEDPQAILDDMMEGVEAADKRRVLVVVDRYQAIKTACMLAQSGDVILVAGKGHENYQEIKGVKHHFDDKEVLAEVM